MLEEDAVEVCVYLMLGLNLLLVSLDIVLENEEGAAQLLSVIRCSCHLLR